MPYESITTSVNAGLKNAVDHAQVAAAQAIETYCLAQLELWQRVPWEALNAADHEQHGYFTERCYLEGLCPVILGEKRDRALFVDLATGKIVPHPTSSLDLAHAYKRRAQVLRIQPDDIDAAKVIQSLRATVDNEMRDNRTHRKAGDAWRAAMAVRLGLTPDLPYVRSTSPESVAA